MTKRKSRNFLLINQRLLQSIQSFTNRELKVICIRWHHISRVNFATSKFNFAFLMRCNQLSGPLISFDRLTKLRNVWFDTNHLTGTLESVGTLPHLTFLQASNNEGIAGALPAALCGIDCRAGGTNVTCAKALPTGCCHIAHCGAAPPVPPAPSTMGECFPQ